MNNLDRKTTNANVNIDKLSNKPDPDVHHGPGPELMSARSLSGNKVNNDKGDNIGEIKDIMLDTRNGRVGYAVMSFGGFLGMGEKLFAVPWNALELDTKNKCFKLNVESGRLKLAPGFDKEKWPDMADSTWSERIHSYYGTKPY